MAEAPTRGALGAREKFFYQRAGALSRMFIACAKLYAARHPSFQRQCTALQRLASMSPLHPPDARALEDVKNIGHGASAVPSIIPVASVSRAGDGSIVKRLLLVVNPFIGYAFALNAVYAAGADGSEHYYTKAAPGCVSPGEDDGIGGGGGFNAPSPLSPPPLEAATSPEHPEYAPRFEEASPVRPSATLTPVNVYADPGTLTALSPDELSATHIALKSALGENAWRVLSVYNFARLACEDVFDASADVSRGDIVVLSRNGPLPPILAAVDRVYSGFSEAFDNDDDDPETAPNPPGSGTNVWPGKVSALRVRPLGWTGNANNPRFAVEFPRFYIPAEAQLPQHPPPQPGSEDDIPFFVHANALQAVRIVSKATHGGGGASALRRSAFSPPSITPEFINAMKFYLFPEDPFVSLEAHAAWFSFPQFPTIDPSNEPSFLARMQDAQSVHSEDDYEEGGDGGDDDDDDDDDDDTVEEFGSLPQEYSAVERACREVEVASRLCLNPEGVSSLYWHQFRHSLRYRYEEVPLRALILARATRLFRASRRIYTPPPSDDSETPPANLRAAVVWYQGPTAAPAAAAGETTEKRDVRLGFIVGITPRAPFGHDVKLFCTRAPIHHDYLHDTYHVERYGAPEDFITVDLPAYDAPYGPGAQPQFAAFEGRSVYNDFLGAVTAHQMSRIRFTDIRGGPGTGDPAALFLHWVSSMASFGDVSVASSMDAAAAAPPPQDHFAFFAPRRAVLRQMVENRYRSAQPGRDDGLNLPPAAVYDTLLPVFGRVMPSSRGSNYVDVAIVNLNGALRPQYANSVVRLYNTSMCRRYTIPSAEMTESPSIAASAAATTTTLNKNKDHAWIEYFFGAAPIFLADGVHPAFIAELRRLLEEPLVFPPPDDEQTALVASLPTRFTE